MGNRDRSMDYIVQRHVIPWERFGLITASGTTLSGLSDGLPVANGISTFGLTGVSMEVDDNIAAMDFHTPCVMNPDHEVGCRVLWTTDQTGPDATDGCTFTVTYDQVDAGEAIIEPVTALDTAIAAQVEGSTTGLKLHRTSRGIIDAGTFDWTSRQGILTWRVDLTAVTTYAAGEITFLGLEIDYYPKLFIDGNEDQEVFRNLAAVMTA